MKNKNIRAILIDPFTQTVKEVNTATGIDALYALLDCTCITITGISFGRKGLDMILDDEGLLKDPEHQRYFKYQNLAQPFAGRALLTSSDRKGNTVSIPHDVYAEHVARDVRWVKPSQQELDKCLDWTITSF